MLRAGICVALIMGIGLSFEAQAEQPEKLPTVSEITDKLDELYRSESSKAEVTMTIVNDRGTRKLELEAWSKGEEHSLIVIRSPSREAGTATLKTDDGLWNYAPRADRLIRIPAGMLSDSWMGSHFSNDDLVRESSFSDDYDTKLSFDELDGQRVIKLDMKPKPRAAVIYTRVIQYVRASDYLPIRSDSYDKDQLVRRIEFSDIRDVGGKPVPHKMEIRPMDKSGERTTMQYTSLSFDVKVDDALFTKRGLRRVAKKR